MKTKSEKISYFNGIAKDRNKWRNRNKYYHDHIEDLLNFFIAPQKSVLDLGCGSGELLGKLNRPNSLGIDFSEAMISIAAERNQDNQNLEFRVGDVEQLDIDKVYDYVILSDLLGELQDIWATFQGVQNVTASESRVIITYYNTFWEPILKLGEKIGMKMPQDYQNWLSLKDIKNLLWLNNFEVIHSGYSLLLPIKIPFISWPINRFLAQLPFFNGACLSNHLVARKIPGFQRERVGAPSVTVLVPCRNEKGNIENLVKRTPQMGIHTEILFVDGNSNDGTVEEVERIIDDYGDKLDIKLMHQVPLGSEDGAGHGKMLKLGKGDAVRKGFERAEGDILMILDADLTVPPEDLPKFYQALVEQKGEFINGSRLVYPMEKEAMRFLNKLANKMFGVMFSWLLGQPVTDTLCGTKALYKKDYLKIVAGRNYFGDFDPFGDFDLLFGAAKQNLRIAEIPIKYKERVYGDIKIERFKHGLLLLKMSWIAMKKLKFR